MEETWMTARWPNHMFCSLLAVTMVNVQNAGVYFVICLKWTHSLLANSLHNNLKKTSTSLPSKCNGNVHDMVKHPIILWHSPHTENLIRVDWSDADPNIRLGSVNAQLSMLELTSPVFQESFTALNVIPNIKWKHQWKNSFIHNSVF